MTASPAISAPGSPDAVLSVRDLEMEFPVKKQSAVKALDGVFL